MVRRLRTFRQRYPSANLFLILLREDVTRERSALIYKLAKPVVPESERPIFRLQLRNFTEVSEVTRQEGGIVGKRNSSYFQVHGANTDVSLS